MRRDEDKNAANTTQRETLHLTAAASGGSGFKLQGQASRPPAAQP